ncbi:MAG: flagellar brake protein [Alcaligenaceae bacterium]|nr:flagellar brake protein [Alcaligenaceae bacterium]
MATFDDDDPFSVTSPLEIKALLKSIMKRNVLMRMHIKGTESSIVTTVLDVNADANAMIVDIAKDTGFNRQATRANDVAFDAMLDGVRVQFSSAGISTTEHHGLPALSVPIPAKVLRIQRREAYRVEIPIANPAVCRFFDADGKPGAALQARDISAGGISLVDPMKQLDNTVGSMFDDCELMLPDVGTAKISVRLVRASDEKLPNGKEQRVLGLRYFNLGKPVQFMIQQYITAIERRLNARRRGFE